MLQGVCVTQVQTALGAILREETARELPCGVFGSFGWSGEAVDELETRLRVGQPCTFLFCFLTIFNRCYLIFCFLTIFNRC